jgi:hypothetical protein
MTKKLNKVSVLIVFCLLSVFLLACNATVDKFEFKDGDRSVAVGQEIDLELLIKLDSKPSSQAVSFDLSNSDIAEFEITGDNGDSLRLKGLLQGEVVVIATITVQTNGFNSLTKTTSVTITVVGV